MQIISAHPKMQLALGELVLREVVQPLHHVVTKAIMKKGLGLEAKVAASVS